jgi:glutamate-1-semialdehyde 2,1-aminomutase
LAALSYVVCGSPGSGASLLCDVLRQAGVDGNPSACFEREAVESLRRNGLRFVWTTREDRLGQALDQARADGAQDFDRARIEAALLRIEAEEREWERFFGGAGVQPIRVRHEHLLDRQEGALAELLHALGLPLPDAGLTALSIPRKGVDLSTEAWRRQYLRPPSAAPAPRFLGLLARARRRAPPWLKRVRLALAPPAAEAPARRYGFACVEHSVPSALRAGSIVGVRVTLENQSDFPWRPVPPEAVYVALRLDGKWVDTHKLPGPVAPGERATIHFPLKAPLAPGTYQLGLDLILWNVAHFSEQGVRTPTMELVVSAPEECPTTAYSHLAARVNPWHYAPTQGIHRGADGASYPVFAARARGHKLWDLAGKEYIDYGMGYGAALLGHGHERVQAAIREAVELSAATVELPFALHLDVSRMLVEDFPCGEMAILGKHGSDGCTVAARLARAYTGRDHILYRGYHGWHDFWAEQPGYADAGIPRRPELLIHEFQYNDLDDFFRRYEPIKDRLAAVMIEPSPHGGDRRGFECDDAGFVRTIADAARRAGALMIFDEIVTGYRYREGSAQKALGVVPDLTCLGKAIAAGMPLSAVVGREEVMRSCMPRIFYPGPTFRGELYSLAAAKAAIETYRTEPVARHVWEHGEKLRRGFAELCSAIGIPGACKGPPFRMQFTFEEPDDRRLCLKRTYYVQEMLKAGVLSANGILNSSYAHDDEVAAVLLERAGRVLEKVADAERKGELERRIEIPVSMFFSSDDHFK